MIIKKGQNLIVQDRRKGTYKAVACDDFDTETTEFYPVEVREGYVVGLTTVWGKGNTIPCRNTQATIALDEENNND